MKYGMQLLLVAGGVSLAASCAPAASDEPEIAAREAPAGSEYVVRDTTVAATVEASGVAMPIAQATLSTKLMGTVTEVLVREGDRVKAGQPLVRIDARDLEAKSAQVAAGISEAEAVYRDALTQAERFRGLYAEDAASRAQLDAAETGLARAEAALERARAAAAELGAVRDYSVIRAPFDGVVTRRFVDPGAFAAPGAPLVAVQDGRRLRIVVHASPATVGALRPGDPVEATIEGAPARAIVEGIVPATGGTLYTVNALVDNDDARYLANGTATLSLVQGERPAVLVPAAAIHRDGDLAGVYLIGENGAEIRWVRLRETGAGDDAFVEVLGGLRAGDRIIVPATPLAGGV
jgi:RND family efflux transporter MFP subunit